MVRVLDGGSETENMNGNRESEQRMLGDDIADRLLEFASQALRIVGRLPNSREGKHIAGQLVKAGTAGGAHYEEARGAESKADFAHKVLLAAKEVGEAVYWIKLARRGGLPQSPDLPSIIGEGKELVAILKASARTARKRAG